MKIAKRILAVVLCIILVLSAVSCGEDSNWIAKKDGKTVPAGVYIYYLMSAHGEAEGKIEDGAELFKSQIDGKDAEDWILDRALQLTKEYMVVEDLFEKGKLTFAEGEEAYVQYYADYLWSYYGEIYTKNGISQTSMYNSMLNASKYSEVFNSLYGEGGEREIPQADIDNYLVENVARLKVITFSIADANGKKFEGDALKEVEDTANAYYERLKNGEDIVTLADEYEAATSEKDETSSDTTSSDVTSSDATSSDATSSEVTSTENTSSDATSSEETDKVDTKHQAILLKNNSTLKAETTEKLFALKTGEYTMVTDETQIIIAQRYDILEDKDASESYASTARDELKGEEFGEYISSLAKDLEAEINQKAIDRYSPKKLKLSL